MEKIVLKGADALSKEEKFQLDKVINSYFEKMLRAFSYHVEQ